MLKVKVTYNPYFVETKIEINGAMLEDGDTVVQRCGIINSRLQNWVDRFFPVLREEYRENQFELTFKGTAQDAEDFVAAFEAYKKDCADVDGKIDTEISGRKGNRIGELQDLFGRGKSGPFSDDFKSEKMQAAFNRATDPTFEVNVIATMSSGKSTVVNSLLGLDLMPAKNEACTATISRITDHDGMKTFVARRLDKNGKVLDDTVEIDSATLSAWNDDERTSVIEIDGDIPTVSETPDCRMVFVDTPGPNNSRNDEHKQTTYKAIESKPLSMVLYVLNSTQLCADDDRRLLTKVCEVMRNGGRKAQDRFVFLANKIDCFDPEKGESVKVALKNVREYLESFGIENPLVIPTSARLAKLVRKQRNNIKLSISERGDMATQVALFTELPEMNMLEHVRGRISGECYRRLEARMAAAESPEAKAEVLSGIPIVEELLNDFLQKHALPAKLKDAVDSLSEVMRNAKIAEKMEAELSKGEKDREELLEKITAFNSSAEKIREGEKMREEVRKIQSKPSKETTAKVTAINVEAENLCKEIISDMSDDDDEISPSAAKRMAKIAISRCKDFDAKVLVTLEEALKSEQLSMLSAMREKYQDFIEKQLKKSFPKGSAAAELQSFALEMPSVDCLVSTYKTTKKVVTGSHEVSTSTWWKPWTWGDTKTVYEYGNKDVVDIASVASDIVQNVRDASMRRIEEFKEAAKKILEDSKSRVLGVMDEIDGRVAKIQSDLEEANRNKDALQKKIDEAQRKVKWYRDFEKDLNKILEV